MSDLSREIEHIRQVAKIRIVAAVVRTRRGSYVLDVLADGRVRMRNPLISTEVMHGTLEAMRPQYLGQLLNICAQIGYPYTPAS